MYYQEKIIEGWDNMRDFLTKFRPGQQIEMLENIGRCADISIEHLSAVCPDGVPRGFYWLRLPASEGARGVRSIYDINERRLEIYEGIRIGEITGKL